MEQKDHFILTIFFIVLFLCITCLSSILLLIKKHIKQKELTKNFLFKEEVISKIKTSLNQKYLIKENLYFKDKKKNIQNINLLITESFIIFVEILPLTGIITGDSISEKFYFNDNKKPHKKKIIKNFILENQNNVNYLLNKLNKEILYFSLFVISDETEIQIQQNTLNSNIHFIKYSKIEDFFKNIDEQQIQPTESINENNLEELLNLFKYKNTNHNILLKRKQK
ncbi:NERD domain-containing protein [Mycoplasmopsis felis]|uniref:NERD domain-containing protein n=1 Tax=Mycoplasmopsis felis TaxID=33923 RepID=UPI002AFF6B58|nr:NERD domain-containing protein [Mycoplasmopsis felis]WQQ05623.1 hypothetical protein RRG59_00730 [Mycoplasmopsis felis]